MYTTTQKDLYGDDMPDIPPGTPDPDGGDDVGTGAGRGSQGRSGTGTSGGGGQGNGGARGGSGGSANGESKGGGTSSGGHGKRTPGSAGGRPFIFYVGTHPDDGGPDPDGLAQTERMQIEGHAIDLILGLEPALCRTPEGSGFDLFEADANGRQTRWVEVKSMTGSLEDRPVGLSHTQFIYAREKGDSYWLYIVEHASDPAQARVLRIQNPVGQSRTFTFDRGWSQIARTDPPH